MNGRADFIPKAPIPRKLRYNPFLFCSHATPLDFANEWNGTRMGIRNSFESHKQSCWQRATQQDVIREVINWPSLMWYYYFPAEAPDSIFLRWKSARLLKRILSFLREKSLFPPDSALSVKANFMQKQITMQQTSHFISHHISKLNDFMKETFYDNRRICLAYNSSL